MGDIPSWHAGTTITFAARKLVHFVPETCHFDNAGKVLQKQATRNLPRLVLNRTTVLLYLRSGLWVAGTLTDLGGALLMIVAFAYAPVSRAGCAMAGGSRRGCGRTVASTTQQKQQASRCGGLWLGRKKRVTGKRDIIGHVEQP